MAQVRGALSARWETPMEFRGPGVALAQPSPAIMGIWGMNLWVEHLLHTHPVTQIDEK